MSDTFREYVVNLELLGDRRSVSDRAFIKIERLTYRELRTRVHQAAHYLSAEGVVSGDRVMVAAPNSSQWIELLLGSLLLGAVVVPVDVISTPEVLQRYIDGTDPKLVFVGAERMDSAKKEWRNLDEFDGAIASSPSTPPDIELDADGPALIVFTSGTTADPKGVVLTQRNVLANIEGVLARVDVKADWRFLSVLPLSHTYELTSNLAILSHGASIYYLAHVTPREISDALANFEITTMLAIPQLLSLMLENVERGAQDEGKARMLAAGLELAPHLSYRFRRILFSSVHRRLGGHLNLVITGGAPIPLDVATTWEKIGIRMVQGYGLTETSPILTCNSLEDRRLDSPGRPLDNVEVRVAENGEIQVRGPSVFHEYWRNPDATSQAFTDDGWFRTGDIGRLDDGYLKIEGRLKFAIVRSSGMKVFPEDVEEAAESDSRLGELCVVGVKGERDESVVAIIVSKESDGVIEEAISSVNQKLESFQHIDSWRRWPDEDFPRTRLLKIDRREVQDWANNESPRESASARSPDGDDPVARVIRLSLDNPNVTVEDHDQLGDLGLDSLRRLNVVALLEERAGVSIADDRVTPTTTVAELRALVSEGSPAAAAVRPARWPYWPWVRAVGDELRDRGIAPLVKHWVTLSVEGVENLETLSSPGLFIFNHSDDFDGPVIYEALPRDVRRRLAVATGADVMADHRVLALIVRLCYAGFPFARSEPYMPSLEYVGQMIDRGYHVLIAPEGRLSTNGELQEFKTGIGLLAASLAVPVVPMKTIGLSGTAPLHAKWPKRRSLVTVRIGRPMQFGATADYEDVTQKLRRAVEEL